MQYNFSQFILSALAVLITLTIHEYAHGFAAYKLGDPTAKNCGRLTLNPLKHLDPIGALCLVLFRFGWAKPVPINSRYFKKPRRDIAISALAGPFSNILFAFLISPFCLLLLNFLNSGDYGSEASFKIALTAFNFLMIFHAVNIGIAIFNLIPVHPLDGSRLLFALLPPKAYFGYMKYSKQIYIGLVCWLLLGDFVKWALLALPFIAANPVLSAVAGVFSLGDMLSFAAGGISELFFDFWRLFPVFR